MKKLLIPLFAFSGFTASQAALVQVDFGATAPATTGWNQIGLADSGIALLDSTGTASGIVVSFTIADPTPFAGASNTAGSSGITDSTIFGDWIGGNQDNAGNDAITLTISGLDATATYDFFFGGERAQNNFGITTEFNGAAVGTDVQGDNYYTQSGVTGSTTATIVITDTERNSYISALTINEVPEPSSLALGGLGMTGLLLRRRRA